MLQLNFDPATNPINNNDWAFPLLESIHIAMFAFAIGTIAIVDFRLLGLALTRQTAVQLQKSTAIWTLIGLIVVITTGLIIFTTDPLRYFYNFSFRLKNVVLLAAILYHYTIHRKVVLANAPPAVNGLVALFSLALWVSIVFLGIFYSFV